MADVPYSPKILAKICPVCHAVGRCLRPKRDGQDYMEYPHPERVKLAEEENNGESK